MLSINFGEYCIDKHKTFCMVSELRHLLGSEISSYSGRLPFTLALGQLFLDYLQCCYGTVCRFVQLLTDDEKLGSAFAINLFADLYQTSLDKM